MVVHVAGPIAQHGTVARQTCRVCRRVLAEVWVHELDQLGPSRTRLEVEAFLASRFFAEGQPVTARFAVFVPVGRTRAAAARLCEAA